eukprot:CAMPEP_0115364526 /NCGR_PEP_ID=MMETSP0270-20121206/103813_1 /TAXON_ID=71861 /ORGANISM="Scrippsiella trochoidea, Strain CCMP3099" /LENGTH=171 /DNA_ID=CAMNT_0002787225 /DNA_START=33 /DNA_END=546 /DNA_ORIENTATION=+
MAVYGWPQERARKVGYSVLPLVHGVAGIEHADLAEDRRTKHGALHFVVGRSRSAGFSPADAFVACFLHVAHVILIVNATVPRPLLGAVDTNLQDEGARARFSSLLNVCKSCVIIVMQPLLTWLFDATAKDYITQVRPLAVLAVFVCATNFLQLLPPLGPMLGQALDDLTAD